tara:strand:- start:757 stop:1035 length:279 start_codon:yes stop_codon:yes gene_type:complete
VLSTLKSTALQGISKWISRDFWVLNPLRRNGSQALLPEFDEHSQSRCAARVYKDAATCSSDTCKSLGMTEVKIENYNKNGPVIARDFNACNP